MTVGTDLVFVGSAADAGRPDPARRVIVTDLAWTPPRGAPDGPLPLREVILDALAGRDLLAESLALLDDWGERTDAVATSTVDGLSAWYHRRLHLWRWLHERLAWLAILDRLLEAGGVTVLVVPGEDPALVQVARLVASHRGIALREASAEGDPGGATATVPVTPPSPGLPPARSPFARLRRLPARLRLGARRWRVDRRLRRLAREPARLLVLKAPGDRQVIVAPGGRRDCNPFLDPVVDALAGTALEPIVLELGAGVGDDRAWARLTAQGGARTLPGEILATRLAQEDDRAAASRVGSVAAAVEGLAEPLLVDGIDFGPALAAELAAGIRGILAARLRDVPRMRRLLRRLRPAGLLLVNEYGRPEWLLAARAEGIPVAAVQHGIIHRLHVGYRHPSRRSELLLPDRTYVFGPFEARLLTEEGVYRPDEVVVAGSPRMDLAGAPTIASPADRMATRQAIRDEVGVAPGDRLVVVSTTAAAVLTRFGVLPALGRILAGPLPGVHVVIKLHPGEPDGAPYERLAAGLATAGGFEAPPMTIVRAIDLYRLLVAADIHVGSYSTVLTEAVAVGTPNLLAAANGGGDLLGYVAAGVARPVRDSAGLLAALEARDGRDAPPPAVRAAFVTDHFRDGPAAPRIRDDLLAWLRPD